MYRLTPCLGKAAKLSKSMLYILVLDNTANRVLSLLFSPTFPFQEIFLFDNAGHGWP